MYLKVNICNLYYLCLNYTLILYLHYMGQRESFWYLRAVQSCPVELERYLRSTGEAYLGRLESLCRRRRGAPSASDAGRACGTRPGQASPSPPGGPVLAEPSSRRCTRHSHRPGPLGTAPPGEAPRRLPPACPSVTEQMSLRVTLSLLRVNRPRFNITLVVGSALC